MVGDPATIYRRLNAAIILKTGYKDSLATIPDIVLKYLFPREVQVVQT